jgi:RHS repeat-associated protein
LVGEEFRLLIVSTNSTRFFRLRFVPGALPPDPGTVAPPLSASDVTPLVEATAFLYTGPNPNQTGVTNGVIELRRAAVLRGKVKQRDNSPLSGVRISILHHPELGQTVTRADGMFDLAVNGGGAVTVNYEKPGYLPAQRQVNAPWQDYALLPDIVMIQVDPVATVVMMGSDSPPQVARGSPQTDTNGTRQATLLFPKATTATMTLSDGTTQPLASLKVRATEYTVGPEGVKAMPAPLPPTSGYTYAVELSADEAIAAGATNVSFSQPLINYVENFLHFPVGSIVPAGFYDRGRGAWVPSSNGRVIKIVGVSAGLADVDTVGSGQLPSLALSDAERQQLASLYTVGQSLWRVAIPHFSPWDFNWPFGPPPGATGPQVPDPGTDHGLDDSDTVCGSVVEAQNQVLGESVRVAGTPFSLTYRSDRTPGRKPALHIPLSGAKLPADLRRIELEISVLGRQFSQSFPAAPNQTTTFTWDGKDAYGRTVQAGAVATVRIGYVYPGVYLLPSQMPGQSYDALFGHFSYFGTPASADATRQEVTLWKETQSRLGSWNLRPLGLVGWSLSPHHVYDPSARVLCFGDGTRRSATTVGAVMTTVAGNGSKDIFFSGDGGPATQAALAWPSGVAAAADGSLYIVDRGNWRIRRVGSDGIITTVAGNGSDDFSGDGGPATQAELGPMSVAVAPDGSLYIADTSNNRIRRVDPMGIITTVAGKGTYAFSGDGGPATQAGIGSPYGVAVAPDGSLYISERGSHRVRRVGSDGIIATVAGGGSPPDGLGDGGPASQAALWNPSGVAVAPDGSLYIADTSNCRIRRVGPNGIITTVAGNGTFAFSGDGGPATQTGLWTPFGIAVAPDGSLYIADNGNWRIRRVGPDGIITTVAGRGGWGWGGDGGPAMQAEFSVSAYDPFGIAVAPDGSLYIADYGNQRLRRVFFPMPGFSASDIAVPSEDGSELFVFTGEGRHLRTLNATTGAVRYQFGYTGAGQLVSVTDGDGRVTMVERDASGDPKAIVAPEGQRTTLAVDTNGCLASISNPVGEAHRMEYTIDGLLTTFTDPNTNSSTLSYDQLGRLVKDQNAAQGFWALSRTEQTNGYTVYLATAENRTNVHQILDLATGDQLRVNLAADGTTNQVLIKRNGTLTATAADGTTITTVQGPDPRFGMQAPFANSLTVKCPSGLTLTATAERTVKLAQPNDLLSLVSETNALTLNGKTFTSVYNASLKQYTLSSPMKRQRLVQTDAQGRVVLAKVAGVEVLSYSYDSRGRLISLTQGSGATARTTTLAYSPQGYLATLTDPLGRSRSFGYDTAGRVTQQTLGDGKVILYAHDANGNTTSLTPPGRPAHTFGHTPVNLLSSYVAPDVGSGPPETRYAYNLDRQVSRVTRPDGQTIDLDYTGASCNCGRLISVTQPRGTTSYTYHPSRGTLAAATSPEGTTLTYAYDGALLTSETCSGLIAGSVSRTYDNTFRLASLSINGGDTVNFQHDDDSLLVQAGAMTLTRDPQNGLVIATSLGAVTNTWSYNGFAEPTNYACFFNGSPLYTTKYVRDQLGRISQKTETIGGVTDSFDYSYDLAGRVTNVVKNGSTIASYTYDSNGNRLSGPGLTTTPAYDDQDRLLLYEGNIYGFNANGELASKTAAGLPTTYQNDALGNLLTVFLPDSRRIDYVIDGSNRRIGKKVNGTLVQGFLYQDGLKPIAELDGANHLVSRFVYATHVNVPDYMVKDGQTYRILTDHLGSPRLVVNAANGTVVQRIDYDEWGNVILDDNPGFQPFGFAGGLYDPDTKLVRFGARDYDAEVGRWTSKDPILFRGGGANLYAYSSGDPINRLDVVGLRDLMCSGFSDDAGRRAQYLWDNFLRGLQELWDNARRGAQNYWDSLWREPFSYADAQENLRDMQMHGEPRVYNSWDFYPEPLRDMVRHQVESGGLYP